MSRYPGTQFKVHDNSQATAIVPVNNVNAADAVQYLTAFASVKGPEGITLTAGDDFYTRYGTQDNIDFKKYGQPLFQASMNINNGAALLAKRVVLDDATLGNATLAVVLTKYKNAKFTVDTAIPSLIESISFDENSKSKYSIAPMVFSIDNTNNYIYAKQQVNEYKERYQLYKKYIEDIVSNEDTPSNVFLGKLFGKDEASKILSGFTQSVYYTESGKVVDINTEGKSSVRKVNSVTTGIYSSNQKTYSSSFTPEDIIDNISAATTSDIKNTDTIPDAKLYKLTVTKSETGGNNTADWVLVDTGKVSYKTVAEKIKSVTRIVTSEEEDGQTIIDNHPEWISDDYDTSNEEYLLEAPYIKTNGYPNVTRLLNDIMVEKSGYIDCEYVFPMFTIFDNGRGESIKSISIEYDSTSSVTLKKAIYTLSVYNYKTAKRLEKFAFSLNPYSRNNNTGYSFDIESAVNYVSKQISVKTYYDSYDALLETLQKVLDTIDEDIITNNDILFGHNLNGKYPAFSSYSVSSFLNRNTYIYDYAHLNIFDNDVLTVNAYCDSDNMTKLDDSDVKYYYYNYVRQQQKLLEKLEKGTDGYCLDREDDGTYTGEVVPFIVIDETDVASATSFTTLSEITGQSNGTVISTTNSNGICAAPILEQNFFSTVLTLYPVSHYKLESDSYKQDTVPGGYYITRNNNTLSRANVFDVDDVAPSTSSGIKEYWKFTSKDSKDAKEIKVWIPYTPKALYQEHYRRFFNGEYDKDIFNLDIYFPNAIFDANYSEQTKLAIQRLVAYRGDLMGYMDMGIGKINSYTECLDKIPSTLSGLELTESDTNNYYYVRDMHIAVTCLSYKIRNPYDNKVNEVTATYGLSNLYIAHYANDVSKVFAGISNGVTIDNIIEGSVSYIPKIYPTSEMTSLNNIGGVYPSDDETIINEKQLMCDLRVNYGCYYDDRFSIETEYTMNPTESEFSYWNNVALVCLMMQSIRKACPTARYQFITAEDLTVYQTAIETTMKPWRNKFASIKFKYVKDDAAIENKIFYAAIEVVFRPFAQAEIFELTALNYSTLDSNVTSV